jgi:hypothetical protein
MSANLGCRWEVGPAELDVDLPLATLPTLATRRCGRMNGFEGDN